MGYLFSPSHLVIASLVYLFPTVFLGVIPFWFICRKAGFSPLFSLLNLVPFLLGTVVLVYFLAFTPWKNSNAPQA